MDELIASLLALLLSSLGTVIIALVMVCVYSLCTGGGSIALGDGLPGAFDDSERFLEEEGSALELMDDRTRQSYLMAKRFIEHNPPNSVDTDISLSQFLTIQEKGVSAWEFTYDALQQSNVTVENRTELEFRGHDICCVQTNLPLPRTKDVVYWEVKIYDMAPETVIGVGLTTKPYPTFRLPGMHRYSVSYESTGIRRLNQPFTAVPYGRKFGRGDVIGVGYRVHSSTIFFTLNGKKLDDVVHGMRLNIFPTVGATGPCNLSVNFGQAGFVFIQAIVKEWGLAPAQGTLAPPPAYGDQDDSVLLESTNAPRERHSGNSPSIGPAPPYVRSESQDDAAHPGPSGEPLSEEDGETSSLEPLAPRRHSSSSHDPSLRPKGTSASSTRAIKSSSSILSSDTEPLLEEPNEELNEQPNAEESQNAASESAIVEASDTETNGTSGDTNPNGGDGTSSNGSGGNSGDGNEPEATTGTDTETGTINDHNPVSDANDGNNNETETTGNTED